MTIAAGTKLGPYEILAPIGAGGIGEVHRASNNTPTLSAGMQLGPANSQSQVANHR